MATTIIEPLQAWANNYPATATQATCNLAAQTNDAQGRGQRWVCTSIIASVAAGATAQTPLQWVLRDGASGAGTILATGALACPADGSAQCALDGLQIRGSLNTQMTLEFTGAGVTASQEAVTLGAYIESATGP